jgi:hypothetical protein
MLQSSISSKARLNQPKEAIMATSDQEQKSINVPQHKRMAMGEKIDGQSMQSKGETNNSKPQGGLSQAKKK